MTTPDDWDPADAVTVAYVCHNHQAYSWHHSIAELWGYDWMHRGRWMQGGTIAYRYGTDGLVDARNKTVAQFLSDSQAPWLLWVDTDMGFPPDVLDRLVEVADPVERPVVGALCFTMRETGSDGLGGWRTSPSPTVYDWVRVEGQQGFAVRWDYPRDTVTQCAGTGSACVLVHRSVFERVFERYGRSWYDKAFNPTMRQETSEDLSFCMRLAALGIPVHVHTGVRTSHQKTVWLGECEYRQTRPPVPAAGETAVIVPVMRRPQNAEPFMRSLRASTGLATVVAVGDRGDVETLEAWQAAGAQVLVVDGDEPGSFARKVNAGYRAVVQAPEPLPMIPVDAEEDVVAWSERARSAMGLPQPVLLLPSMVASEPEWLFMCGDDVRFWPGWLSHAQEAAGDRFHVVGTQDLGNPRVVEGRHATHLLIRRSYVDEVGASWDGPKVVTHEGYRHWFPDDEVVAAAKQRSVWTMADLSVVEHLHPAWGKAEDNEVYELGRSFAEQDRALFTARCEEYM